MIACNILTVPQSLNLSSFLTSQTIALEASNSSTSFHVHEHLIRSVSPVLLAAVSREWNEKSTRRYKFCEDVSEELLLHFLMWTYHDNYLYLDTSENETTFSEEAIARIAAKVPVDGRVEEPANNDQKAEETAEGPEKLHPLLLHIKLYIFADMYMIEPLKTLSMEKLIGELEDFGELGDGYEREAVFDALTFAFSSRVPVNDVLLHWLARYASWRLDQLKQMPSSLERLLLQTDGNFATLLVRYVKKSSSNPFTMKMEDIKPKYPISLDRS